MNTYHLFFIVVALMCGMPAVFTKQVALRKRFGDVPEPKTTDSIKSDIPVGVSDAPKKKKLHKKRIVVFSSRGGGGHTAVSKGLKAYLEKDYNITIVNIFDEVLRSVDTLGSLTWGKINGEDFYNFCLRCRWTNLVGTFATTGAGYLNWRQSTVEKLVLEYFADTKPDLIVSVIPFVNAALLAVAEKLSVPFLVLTNDLDTTNYVNGIAHPTYQKFRYTLAFDDPGLKEKIKQAQIPDNKIVVTGFPLRPAFFAQPDVKALKKEFKVPKNRPVVMVFMGGAGSLTIYRYVRTLARMKMPLHMIVVLGRNEQLKRNISKILLPPGVTMTLLGFTDRIADLMAMSDILITKPGPGSVCEAVESNLPMILDQTHGTIWWELMNVEFVIKNGFGVSLTQFADVPVILKRYLDGEALVIKEKMKQFKRECFKDRIKPLIEELLVQA